MNDIDQYEFLRQFYEPGLSDYNLLIGKFKHRTFKRNEFITVPGQIQKELYFVKSGVQMSYFDTDNKTHVMAFTYPPNLCAIPESFSFQTPSSYYLACLTDSEMNYISFDELQMLFDQSHHLERLFRKMTEAVLAGMINRHIELHSLTIEERFKAFCQRSSHLLQLVPHKYIASYLGITQETLSRLRAKK